MRINILRKNLAAIDKERKLNAQKRIRINRKPYITESKENVERMKSEKSKLPDRPNKPRLGGDTEIGVKLRLIFFILIWKFRFIWLFFAFV